MFTEDETSMIETIDTGGMFDQDQSEKKSSQEILEGLKKRVILGEMAKRRKKSDDLVLHTNVHNMYERTHFVQAPVSEHNNAIANAHNTMRLTTYFSNAHLRSLEYSQLLECLSKPKLLALNHFIESILIGKSRIFLGQVRLTTFVRMSFFNPPSLIFMVDISDWNNKHISCLTLG
jgi:hypothetical protein